MCSCVCLCVCALLILAKGISSLSAGIKEWKEAVSMAARSTQGKINEVVHMCVVSVCASVHLLVYYVCEFVTYTFHLLSLVNGNSGESSENKVVSVATVGTAGNTYT